MEAIYEKEPSDDENFQKKGLNKWVCARTGEIRVRKTWDKVGSTAKKETFDFEESNNKFVDGGFGGMDPILTNATPNIIFLEAMPSVKSLTDWLEREIKSKLLKRIKDNHLDEYNSALQAIKGLQTKVEEDGYLGQIKEGANKYFSKTFPELELNICATPYKEAELVKAFEKDFSITIGNKQKEALAPEAALAQVVERIEALSDSDESNPEKSVEINETPSGRTFDLHGHGLIRQAIINILGLFRDSKSDQKQIILFEEPELYLHPSNKRKFRETLYNISEQENYQIICVSHDPQLIDLSRQHTSLARFVKLNNGETAVYQAGDNVFCKDEDTKNRIQMLNRFNPHICETFFSDEVVLVEGDTEAIVTRELLSDNYPDKEIFVLNTGSKNNIPFFMKILRHFRISQHVIHDSDERYLYKEGVIKKNNDGTYTANSAWTLNKNIWDDLMECNAADVPTHRYVSIRNFEDSHNYKHDKDKGKPLSAYEYAKSIDFSDNSISIVKFVKQIAGDLPREEFTPEILEQIVKEPH